MKHARIRSGTQFARFFRGTLAARAAGAVAAATILPLAITGFLAYRLAAYSFETSARGQVQDALFGAIELVDEHRLRVERGEETLETAVSRLRRVYAGSLAEFHVASFSVTFLVRLFVELGIDPSSLVVSPHDSILSWSSRKIGRIMPGAYVVDDPELVRALEIALERIPIQRQQEFANGPMQLRLVHDLSKAAVRIRSSGYVFALTQAVDDGGSGKLHEVFHPRLSSVDVSDIRNDAGEPVARELVALAGTLVSRPAGELVWTDYFWKNPGEPRARDKLTYVGYYRPWNWTIAAGLYRDEFFAPLRSVRLFLTLSVIAFGLATAAIAYRATLIWFVRRIDAVVIGIGAVEKGSYLPGLPEDWRDELGDIARAVNAMAAAIGDRENRLDDLRAFQSGLLDALPTPILVIDPQGRIEAWNEASLDVFGREPEALAGRGLTQACPALAELGSDVERTRSLRERQSFVRREFDMPGRRAFSVVLEPLGPVTETSVVISFFDLADVDRLERQLRRSQKLETVGTLAAGLAHDLNNVLGGIVGTASVLGLSADDPRPPERDEVKDAVQSILRSSRHAAEVVRQLLVLSRRQEMTLAPVDLATIVESTVRLCRRTFDPSVEIAFERPDSACMVMGEAVQLEQALLNLLVNARDAMTIMRAEGETRGGQATVRIEKRIPESGDDARPLWAVSVTDEGVGIATEAIERIFDPFFTTKIGGKGSGLGLTMVFGITERHGGTVHVDSMPGRGTTVELRLPQLSSELRVATPAEPVVRPSVPGRGQGRVLVAEDDAVMLESLGRMLKVCGYDAFGESRGEAAIRRFEAAPEEYAAAVLDLAMPGMSGLDLALALRARRPDLPILLVSGYDEDERIDRARMLPKLKFLRKPFGIEALSVALGSLLGA
ncbi:MAG: response regulator [Spirochaetales bacterium]|nr:response regulator [Spirochaetales bacterium]